MRLTDWSNFQPVPDAATCSALLAAGFTGAIVGLQRAQVSMAQTAALRTGGITVEDCYIENTPNPPLPSGLLRGWVAVEDGSGFNDEASIDGQLDYLRSQGLEAGIYTSMYMLERLGLTSLFADKYASVPLWLANYSEQWDGALPGGAAMVQYSGTGSIPGIPYQLDLNYRPDAPQPAPAQMEDDMGKLSRLDAGRRIALFEAWAKHDVTDDTIVAESDAPPSPQYRRFVVDIPVAAVTDVAG